MAYNPEHYKQNKEKYNAKSKAWREANPEKAKENRKRNYEINKERDLTYSTKYNRLKRTGVTDEKYQIQLEKQQGLCAICKGTCTKALAADHCHNTNTFRGLLCNNCNRGLGHFKDNPQLLIQAIKYLASATLVEKVEVVEYDNSYFLDDGA